MNVHGHRLAANRRMPMSSVGAMPHGHCTLPASSACSVLAAEWPRLILKDLPRARFPMRRAPTPTHNPPPQRPGRGRATKSSTPTHEYPGSDKAQRTTVLRNVEAGRRPRKSRRTADAGGG